MAELSLQEAIRLFLKNSKLKQGILSVKIEEVWENLMGKTIAGYTDQINVSGNTLFITTTVAALKNELMMNKEKIIEQVNQALGEKVIQYIVIK